MSSLPTGCHVSGPCTGLRRGRRAFWLHALRPCSVAPRQDRYKKKIKQMTEEKNARPGIVIAVASCQSVSKSCPTEHSGDRMSTLRFLLGKGTAPGRSAHLRAPRGSSTTIVPPGCGSSPSTSFEPLHAWARP